MSSLEGEGGSKRAVTGFAWTIRTQPLDELIEHSKISSVRLIKTDVVGFDWDALDSSTAVIKSSWPLIYFELQYFDKSQYLGFF